MTDPLLARYTVEGAYNQDALLAGDTQPRNAAKVTIALGAAHVRGELLGQITASGKYIKSLAAAEDGSEAPSAILAHDVDASGGDAEGIVYLTGEFNPSAMTFGTGQTAAGVAAALRALGIFLRNVVAA